MYCKCPSFKAETQLQFLCILSAHSSTIQLLKVKLPTLLANYNDAIKSRIKRPEIRSRAEPYGTKISGFLRSKKC